MIDGMARTVRSPTSCSSSQNTSGVHVSKILGKLGVAGRGELAAVAHRLGLVEAEREPA